MSGKTPTQRTMDYFRNAGMAAGIVERWIPNPKHPGGGFRKDFLGIIDVIFFSRAEGIVGVQSCGQDFSAHRRKILHDKREDLAQWLEAGGRFLLIGWRKVKVKRGGTAVRWEPRIEEMTAEAMDREEKNAVEQNNHGTTPNIDTFIGCRSTAGDGAG